MVRPRNPFFDLLIHHAVALTTEILEPILDQIQYQFNDKERFFKYLYSINIQQCNLHQNINLVDNVRCFTVCQILVKIMPILICEQYNTLT